MQGKFACSLGTARLDLSRLADAGAPSVLAPAFAGISTSLDRLHCMVAEGKTVTLVLCTRDGRVLGALPAFNVDTPWWQEVGDLVDAARELHGLEVTVLRLI